MHKFKKIFSSGDLSSECDDVDPSELPPAARPVLQQQPMPGGPPNIPPPPAPGKVAGSTPAVGAPATGPELSLSFGKAPPTPRGVSAPSSPAKSRESLLQRVQSLTGAARDQGASIISSAVSSARVQAFTSGRYFNLLVVDDQNTDWSKYFRGKRLHGDYDIRVEQAEFKEISLTANADAGTLINLIVYRGGAKVTRSFRPDFILVRQPPRDGIRDYRSMLLGLKYGGVPSINSLNSLYQFQDKPWVFAHLLQLQRRLGKDAFPLIDQQFFISPREMANWQLFPCVLKAGHCHGGASTAKLDSSGALQDAVGLLCAAGSSEFGQYCSLEPYVDAKFDIHIQKIGSSYKAYMRKSITGNWKTNQGSAMLEKTEMTEKYKTWVDEVSELFGGMEVCRISVVVSKEGKEFILGAADSTFPLIGETQEEDRRQISEIVATRMQNVCRPQMTKTASRSSVSGSPVDDAPVFAAATPTSRPMPSSAPPPIPERSTPGVGSLSRHGSISSTIDSELASDKPSLGSVGRRDSQASQSSQMSTVSGTVTQKTPARTQAQSSVTEDAEDTMKNLRKTFAGIFGDM